MHRLDRIGVEVLGQFERGSRRSDVSDNCAGSMLPSSASAIAFASDVTFLIIDDEAASDLSNTDASNADSAPSSASKRAISTEAS